MKGYLRFKIVFGFHKEVMQVDKSSIPSEIYKLFN